MQPNPTLLIVGMLSAVAGAQPDATETMLTPPESVRMPAAPSTTPMGMAFMKPSIDIMINGEGPFTLLVDTGASPTLILNRDLAEELGLDRTGTSAVGDPTDPSAIEVAVHPVDSVQIGGATFTGIDAISWDRGTLYEGHDAPRGVVGFPMFRDVLVTFDYPGETMRLETGSLERGEHVVEYTAPQGIPHIPVTIGGETYEAHLDSGSMAAFMLPLEMEDRLQLASPMREMGRGRTVNSEFVLYSADYEGEISIAGHPIKAPTLGFTKILPMPNVGSQVLSNFAVTFDQHSSLARFELAAGSEARVERPRGGLGIVLGRQGEDYFVSGTMPDTPAAAADLQEGDRLLAVNGIPMRDLPPGDLAVEMRKQTVVLTIDRTGDVREITIRRD